MNSYELSRPFWDWAFENPEKITPSHAGFMFWLIELNNRLGWKPRFSLPTFHTMEVLGIKSYKTYKSILNDLIAWGFVKLHQKAKNNHTANVIELVIFTKSPTKSLTNSLTNSSPSQVQVKSTIDKPQTIKPKTINQETALLIFDSFRKKYPGTKRGNPTEFENFKKKHSDWQEVLPILDSIIDNQIQSREQRRQNKEFIPAWKNLQTWINQRCWEEEIKVTKSRMEEVNEW